MIGLIFGDTDFPKEILKTVKKRKIKYLIIDLSKSKNRPELVIGFAAETSELIKNAESKLTKKGCDIIVANKIDKNSTVLCPLVEMLKIDSQIPDRVLCCRNQVFWWLCVLLFDLRGTTSRQDAQPHRW